MLFNIPFIGFFGLGLAIVFLPILWFIIGILIAIWVYKDAESRGESGVLWLILVIITGIIGLIIWLIVRPEKRKKGKGRFCPECGSEVGPNTRYCPECGKEL